MATIVPINTDPAASVLEYRASLGLGTSILTGTLNATNVNTTNLSSATVTASTVTASTVNAQGNVTMSNGGVLSLAAPLSLSTAAPASFSDLGYTSNISTNPSTINMTSAVIYAVGSLTLALPGVYYVSAMVNIQIPTGTSISNTLIYHYTTPNCTVNNFIYNQIPYGPTVFSAPNNIILQINSVIVIQSPGSSTCTLYARIIFTGGTTPYILANTSPGATYTITRIG